MEGQENGGGGDADAVRLDEFKDEVEKLPIIDLLRHISDRRDPEIVIGLVGPVGTQLGAVADTFARHLAERKYAPERIRLSKLIQEFAGPLGVEIDARSEDTRISTFQDVGDALRRELRMGAAVTALAVTKIRGLREENGLKPNARTAYILNSLKNPAEVEVLREIYGDGFVLVAVHASRADRIERLASKIGRDKGRGHNPSENDRRAAGQLDARDRKGSDDKFGQNVRDTFALADFFVDESGERGYELECQRICDAIFGSPFLTPTRDENAMFHAQAARLRSGALGRQVGAVITDSDGEVIAVGANEVPKAGGGLYWPPPIGVPREEDPRDIGRGTDESDLRKRAAMEELLRTLVELGKLSEADAEELLEGGLPGLKKAFGDVRLLNLIEFGRTSHAEMSAILAAARRGTPVKGKQLYCTTFPCHECTRHIITAGLNEVVYIEPYPKSLGPELHDDSVRVDVGRSEEGVVNFRPFMGVGPRMYSNVFEMDERKDGEGNLVAWPEPRPDPRFGVYHVVGSLIEELKVVSRFKKEAQDAGLLDVEEHQNIDGGSEPLQTGDAHDA